MFDILISFDILLSNVVLLDYEQRIPDTYRWVVILNLFLGVTTEI